MKKIVYFVSNGVPTPDDLVLKSILTKEGHKVSFSNGNVPWGFEDSCGKVVMSQEFKHVRDWCDRAGIDCVLFDKAVDIDDAEIVEDKPAPKKASPKPAAKKAATKPAAKTEASPESEAAKSE